MLKKEMQQLIDTTPCIRVQRQNAKGVRLRRSRVTHGGSQGWNKTYCAVRIRGSEEAVYEFFLSRQFRVLPNLYAVLLPPSFLWVKAE